MFFGRAFKYVWQTIIEHKTNLEWKYLVNFRKTRLNHIKLQQGCKDLHKIKTN